MDQMTFEIIRILVYALVSILGVLITRQVVPYLKGLALTEEQKVILTVINEAVLAMEQIITASGQGRIKKAKVVSFVQQYLLERNISISEEEIDKLIEAAVYAMKQAQNKEN